MLFIFSYFVVDASCCHRSIAVHHHRDHVVVSSMRHIVAVPIVSVSRQIRRPTLMRIESITFSLFILSLTSLFDSRCEVDELAVTRTGNGFESRRRKRAFFIRIRSRDLSVNNLINSISPSPSLSNLSSSHSPIPRIPLYHPLLTVQHQMRKNIQRTITYKVLRP